WVGQALHQVAHHRAEPLAHLLERDVGVLDDVVQPRGRDHLAAAALRLDEGGHLADVLHHRGAGSVVEVHAAVLDHCQFPRSLDDRFHGAPCYPPRGREAAVGRQLGAQAEVPSRSRCRPYTLSRTTRMAPNTIIWYASPMRMERSRLSVMVSTSAPAIVPK